MKLKATCQSQNRTVIHPSRLAVAQSKDYYRSWLSLLAGDGPPQVVMAKQIDFGPHTPIASFRRGLAELRPQMLWISVSHLADEDRFLTEYRELYEEAERAGVAVLRCDVLCTGPLPCSGHPLTRATATA